MFTESIDIFSVIAPYMTPKELLRLEACNINCRNLVQNNLTWKTHLPISPPWDESTRSFAGKYFDAKVTSCCIKCGKLLDRSCKITLCDCMKSEHFGNLKSFFPRFHPECLKTLTNETTKIRCVFCKSISLTVTITSFP